MNINEWQCAYAVGCNRNLYKSPCLDNLVDQGWKVGPLKGLLQAGHLIQDAAQRPDITFCIVVLTFTLCVGEREREREMIWLYTCTCLHIYIYINVQRYLLFAKICTLWILMLTCITHVINYTSTELDHYSTAWASQSQERCSKECPTQCWPLAWWLREPWIYQSRRASQYPPSSRRRWQSWGPCGIEGDLNLIKPSSHCTLSPTPLN